ncbi:MAG TPA: hypothetical protein VD790_00325 [Thermoleophilaceae bacterium]|nr:hypothetical protein [Thermoleophilaceae bacterium]
MLGRLIPRKRYATVGFAVVLATSLAAPLPASAASPAENKARDLIDAARKPCKLEPPTSTGVSVSDSGFGGVKEVSATVVRKPPVGTSGAVAGARWEVDDGKLRPLDPMAGEINRRCGDDPGKPDSPFDWRSLPYFGGYDQAYLYLITSKRWGRADQVTKHLPGETGSQDWGEVGGYIWSEECDPGKDSVRLERTVHLPGRPFGGAPIRGSLNTLGSILGPDARPITTVKVLLNGQTILRVKKNGDPFDFDDIPAKLFKSGANRVEIRAEKRRTGKCNSRNAPTLVGVEFSLYATYGSDLKVVVPEHARSNAFGIDIPFTVVNKGPSDIPEARFAFSFTIHTEGGKAVLSHMGAGDCDLKREVIQPPRFGESFTCRVPDIERGESKKFAIRVVPGLPDGEDYWGASLTWSSRIAGMGEVDGSNQNGLRHITGCFIGKDPRCPKDPPASGASLLGF